MHTSVNRLLPRPPVETFACTLAGAVYALSGGSSDSDGGGESDKGGLDWTHAPFAGSDWARLAPATIAALWAFAALLEQPSPAWGRAAPSGAGEAPLEPRGAAAVVTESVGALAVTIRASGYTKTRPFPSTPGEHSENSSGHMCIPGSASHLARSTCW